jgi:hypothetical protein
MNAPKAFAIILTGALGFALVGGGIGFLIGTFAPDYYYATFQMARWPTGPSFDPVQAGLGLGITQGFVGGTVVGVLVVLAIALAQRWPGRPRVELGDGRRPVDTGIRAE